MNPTSGTGDSIRIFGDRWIPNHIISVQDTHCQNDFVREGKVCDIISEGDWNLTPLRQIISDEMAAEILKIKIPTNGVHDKLIWLGSENGEYSVSKAYAKAHQENMRLFDKPSSSCHLATNVWKALWKLKIMPRVQHFIWRVLNDAVATKVNLFKRRKTTLAICPICELQEETGEHLFFQCPWTRCVWFGCVLGARLEVDSIANFKRWWIAITDQDQEIDNNELLMICWLLWNIWKHRNGRIFDHSVINPMLVIEEAASQFHEYQITHGAHSEQSSDLCIKTYHWVRPPDGFLKINSDGAFYQDTQNGAIGIVCRDDAGTFKWGFVDKIKSVSAFMSEALALKRALMLATDLGHDKVIFETDSQLLAQSILLHRTDLYDWRSRSIVHDIIHLLKSNVGFSISFFSRQGNAAADRLAAEAFKGVCPLGWVHQPSLSLQSILTFDAESTSDSSSPSLQQQRGVG